MTFSSLSKMAFLSLLTFFSIYQVPFTSAAVLDVCREVINDFVFGLYEEEVDGVPVLTKQDPEKNVTIQMEWAKYAQCVKYVRRDAWTAKEYLEQTPPSYSVALGRQYPVLLSPAKPDLSRFFLIPALDFVVGGFVKHSGVYDANEENILRKLIREGDCILEIGANIGSYTVVLADEVGLAGKVYAYEPFRKIFHILSANVALQGYGNVVTRQVGFSNKVSVQTVNAPDLNDYINLGAARVFHQQKEEVAHVHFDGKEEIEVETIDGLHSRDLIKCGEREWIMKIDTEGMEKEVVEGGLGVIQKYWPLIYVESQPYFSDGDRRFVDFMAETVGYNCSPIKQLEMHEILLCMPIPKQEYWNSRISADFAAANALEAEEAERAAEGSGGDGGRQEL